MNMKIISNKMLRTFALAIAFATVLGISGRVFAQSVNPSICVSSYAPITTNLYIGESDYQTGSQVTSLQSYLYNNGYMTHTPTGYFGGLTWQGVVNFQRAYGISATGFVGPITRGELQTVMCGTPVPNPIPNPNSVSIASITPSVSPVGTTVTISGNGFTSFGSNTIHFGAGVVSGVSPATVSCQYPSFAACYDTHNLTFTIPSSVAPYCAPGMMCAMYMQLITPGNYPVYVTNANGTSNTLNFTVSGANMNTLSITGIDSPSSLPMSTPGTWSVHATMGTGGNLHYSVIWGDEPVYAYNNAIVASPQQTIQSSATFSHAYARAGTFTPTFTVTDDNGHSATTSATVMVTPMYVY
jgi:peptidoglycan hydrolase-like protein with peptidoglycan-binding domain